MGCLYPFGQAGDQRQNSDQTPAPTRRAPKLARSKKFCRGRERYDVFGPKGGTQRNQTLWIPNVQIYMCCATYRAGESSSAAADTPMHRHLFCAVFSHVLATAVSVGFGRRADETRKNGDKHNTTHPRSTCLNLLKHALLQWQPFDRTRLA